MCTLNFFFFFFNDTATTEIYTLSLHDALPILRTLAQASDLDPHLHKLEYLRRVQTGADDVLLILVSAEYWLEWFHHARWLGSLPAPTLRAHYLPSIRSLISRSQIGRASCRERV